MRRDDLGALNCRVEIVTRAALLQTAWHMATPMAASEASVFLTAARRWMQDVRAV